MTAPNAELTEISIIDKYCVPEISSLSQISLVQIYPRSSPDLIRGGDKGKRPFDRLRANGGSEARTTNSGIDACVA